MLDDAASCVMVAALSRVAWSNVRVDDAVVLRAFTGFGCSCNLLLSTVSVSRRVTGDRTHLLGRLSQIVV